MENPRPDSPKPFRLLDLPAELRLLIYEHALTAPDKIIRIYYSYQSNRISPGLALALLRTCRQVYSEARDVLYQENTVFVHADCHFTASPIIPSPSLPPPALPHLRTLFAVLDASDLPPSFSSSPPSPQPSDIPDFRPFQSMTSLQHLRLAILAQQEQRQTPTESNGSSDTTTTTAAAPWMPPLLAHVLERVPAACALAYGAASPQEKAFAAAFCRAYGHRPGLPRAVEVPGEAAMRAAAYCGAERGCRSGSAGVDWRGGAAGAGGGAAAAAAVDEVRTW